MQVKIYGSCKTTWGRQLLKIDEVNTDLEAVISFFLNTMWEKETTDYPSLIICNRNGELVASLTLTKAIGPVSGVVEIYRVGKGIESKLVEFKFNSSGHYSHTEVHQA